MTKPRIDLFTTIHKGLRAMLFDLATDAARIDLTSNIAVDLLVERILRAVDFFDEHARHEDTHVFPAIRAAAPELAHQLASEHLILEAVQAEVEACAESLAEASADERWPIGAQLVRLLNRLIIQHLAHMGREETEANEALWAAHSDDELLALQMRLVNGIAPARFQEWMIMISPALDPLERSHVTPGQSAVG
jgi:hypothetical protein